ncbi:hypothetical protein SASPL_104701 [Salvia splendens]|uniref:Poly [ADP-ribose] polymerase n=1 Tax=Salvia splendens TaxID=180675 RepID=A0A8X9AAX2_SALSN|nr:hypothetical protein SASPL_104701 [Salvia splendens]
MSTAAEHLVVVANHSTPVVHETRSHAYSSGNEEKVATRKQKAAAKASEGESEHSPKKAKTDTEERTKDVKKEKTKNDKGEENGNERSTEEIIAEFEKFCKETSEHLSIKQMREILEANGQDAGESDDAVVPKCQDVLFYGPLDDCPVCGGPLKISDKNFSCSGVYTEWSTCTFTTKDPPRRNEPTKLPDSVKDSHVAELLKTHQDPKSRLRPVLPTEKPLKGMMICLAGRLTRTHQYWKSKIEKAGGKVANSVMGVSCLVVSPAERERGGSSKLTEAMDKGIPVVRETWLSDSIEKEEPQPLGAYDIASDLSVGGKGVPLYQQDPSKEALETITSELKVYGKRGVHKDTKLQDVGGQILEQDGILYNCAFTLSDKGAGLNEYCIMQLITVPEGQLYMYYKKGKIGNLDGVDEKLEERDNVDGAIQEFAKLFEGVTGNKFEPWGREKKIQKRLKKLFPIDMDDGVEVRHGGLALRQLGTAALHCKLEPKVAKFMEVLCSQEIYRYAMMEMGLDFPDLPLGMVTEMHLKRCEDTLHEFAEILRTNIETGPKRDALWADFSQRMFTLLPSTRPYVFRDFTDIADHGAAAVETIRDINVASRLIGDVSGSTLDDPLFERYKQLGCSISPVEKDSDDYKMVANYLEKTYEPIKVGEISYGVSIKDVFAVEVSAGPSFDEIKKLPNKVLLWCGTRSSNLLRHLEKSFLPSVCFLPVAGYMFGRAIVCSDAAAEAARYGFTAVDRPEGFLVLAVASLGEQVTELEGAPEDAAELEEKKHGVIGRGRKKTDESEHTVWNDVKVPCGKLVQSEHKDSPLEYNEYALVAIPTILSFLLKNEVFVEEFGVLLDEVKT